MATLRLSNLILQDKWPGIPNINAGRPTATINGKAGWDNTVDNFTTADQTAKATNPPVPIGEKRTAYTDNSNCPGWYTMMYLCLHSFENGMDISKDVSDGLNFHAHSAPGCASTAEWADTSKAPYFVVSRCTTGSDMTKGAPIAIFCSTYTQSDGTVVATQGYGDGYGWAWVGGVCPCKDITILDDASGNTKGADITVDTACDAGPVIMCQTAGVPLILDCDETNAQDVTTMVVLGKSVAAITFGWACISAA